MVRTVPICVTLRKTQVDRLRSVQARVGENRSEVVRRAVEDWLRKFEAAPPERDEERATAAG